jgi:hypothetical protein
MATKTFTTMVSMQNYIDSKCTIAIENAAKRLQEKLVEFIDNDYYAQYDPLYYKPRTFEFLKSAVSKMLNSNTASIGIDDEYFNYEYPARYMMFENGGGTDRNVSGHWTGEDQVNMAAQGYHGTYNIRTEGRFWEDFVDYCETNAVNILKQELKKQGLNVQ